MLAVNQENEKLMEEYEKLASEVPIHPALKTPCPLSPTSAGGLLPDLGMLERGSKAWNGHQDSWVLAWLQQGREI